MREVLYHLDLGGLCDWGHLGKRKAFAGVWSWVGGMDSVELMNDEGGFSINVT
jgi:hypothetical protein